MNPNDINPSDPSINDDTVKQSLRFCCFWFWGFAVVEAGLIVWLIWELLR